MLGSIVTIPITVTVRNENQTAFEPVLELSLKVDDGRPDLSKVMTSPRLVPAAQVWPCFNNNSAVEKCLRLKRLRNNTEVETAALPN